MHLGELPGQVVGLVSGVDYDPLLLVVAEVDVYVEHRFFQGLVGRPGVFGQHEVVGVLSCLVGLFGRHQHFVVFGAFVGRRLLLEVLVEVLF